MKLLFRREDDRLLGVHIIVKFAFFALPYRSRRNALDKSYGPKPSATSTFDVVVLILTVALSGLLLWRGVEAVSFLGGLWIGATLIQRRLFGSAPQW